MGVSKREVYDKEGYVHISTRIPGLPVVELSSAEVLVLNRSVGVIGVPAMRGWLATRIVH